MFTGIVEEVGRLVRVEAAGQGARRLTVEAKLLEEEQALGASLAFDGVCLTIVKWSRGRAEAVAAAETLARTTLGSSAAGDRVNLERPLRMGDRLGGHLVAGHVDGVGHVRARADRGEALDLTIACAPSLLRYVVEKGSVALDGISLTVNQVDATGLTVSLIPHTQTATTLGAKALGVGVNVEVDLIGKYVEKLVAPHAATGGLTLQKLSENGFV